MNFAFTSEQEQLRKEARRFLEKHSSLRDVRRAMESEAGFDRALWKKMAEMGWLSLAIPEEFGGAEAGRVELVGLVEEMGRSLVCAPFFSTVCLGVTALLSSSIEARSAWLAQIARGEAIVAFALDGVTARREKNAVVLDGKCPFVIDGQAADLLLVVARFEDRHHLFPVAATAQGLTRVRLTTLDPTRRQSEITFDKVAVSAGASYSEEALEQTLNMARVTLAAESLGGAERCLEMAVEYAKTRTQFGRAIGSFQAVKHKCADMLMKVEAARSAVYAAACASEEELPMAAAVAKAYASETFFHCAAECVQIHGGIGFTWEHDAHLFLKRARSNEALFGTPTFHRERIATWTGL